MDDLRWPKRIKVGGHDFALKWRKGVNPLGNQAWGITDPKTNEIVIDDEAASSRKVEVVLHETLHAVLFPLRMEREANEDLVVFLGEGLTQVFRDNPKLIQACLAALQ